MTKIVVDSDGNILDGHNRLQAYVKLIAEIEKNRPPVVDKFRPEEVIEMDDELLSKLID
jgi:1,4-dihydroxy-2-naphthoyl-CoA synthase